LEELSTARLVIRPFVSDDLPDIRRILNLAFAADDSLEDVGSWLDWNVLGARWFPAVGQPPYGDRGIVLRATGQLVGAVGFVPLLMPFDRVPELVRTPGPGSSGRMAPEVGLFWAIDPAHQQQGYATEAGGALIRFAFDRLRLWRILATTRYENAASQAVMRRLGMTLTHNPHPEPEWMQVVGVKYPPPAGVSEIRQEGLLT
jgi:ribosomal-protein-alanine N-acetyltransferase